VIVPHSAARNIKGYSPRFLTRSQAAADRDRELALAWRRRGLDLPSGALLARGWRRWWRSPAIPAARSQARAAWNSVHR
jgi:hypothetical protein